MKEISIGKSYSWRVGDKADVGCYAGGWKVYSNVIPALSDLVTAAEAVRDNGDKDAAHFVAALSAALLQAVSEESENIPFVKVDKTPF